jgi:hypothetical protein
MSFFKSLRASWRKSADLKRISQTLGAPALPAPKIFLLSARRPAAEDELFDLIERDPAFAAIIDRKSREDSSTN